MAPENGANNGEEGLEFEMVESTQELTSGAAPDTEGGLLHSSGRLQLNTLGSEEWAALIREAGLHLDKAACLFGTNKAKGVVAAYPVDPLRPDIKPTPFRWTGPKKELASLHLGPVFKDVPELKPTGKRSVVVSRIKDKNGTPCLAIYLNIALAKRTNRRGPAKEGPAQEAAPGADSGAEDESEE